MSEAIETPYGWLRLPSYNGECYVRCLVVDAVYDQADRKEPSSAVVLNNGRSIYVARPANEVARAIFESETTGVLP